MNATSLNIRVFVLTVLLWTSASCKGQPAIEIPELTEQPAIDGDLSEWKEKAWQDGVWDLKRVQRSPWFQPKRNRLVRHADEDSTSLDLSSHYYLAWKGEWLYFGAEVKDNVNDVMDTLHEPKRWYYKDAIALFIEAPRDTIPEKFGEGDHAFCFVADTTMPAYGAWWRHGTKDSSYIEEPLAIASRDYAIQISSDNGRADYVIEARINLRSTFGAGHPMENADENPRNYSLMIVHCDPDGGEYGGHLLIYGKGDNDASWWQMHFVPTNDY